MKRAWQSALVLASGLATTSVRGQATEAVAVVELSEHGAARVAGRRVPFDGLAEGLSWPALEQAVGRGQGGAVTLRVSRGVPTIDVLRAAWTLRARRVRLEGSRADGVAASATFDPRPPPGAQAPTGCHVAVFVAAQGGLRVATPGGPVQLSDAAALTRALESARATCPLRYVAVGAEADDAPWGPVFDVAVALEQADLGGARKVLGQALVRR